MFQFFRVQKARRSVVDQITPLIDYTRARRGNLPDKIWRMPYMIGYLTMLISLLIDAKTKGPLTSDNLGLAQLEIWQKITGLNDENIGEQICALSAACDQNFANGCENAGRFFKASHGEARVDDDVVRAHFSDTVKEHVHEFDQPQTQTRLFGPNAIVTEPLWQRYFEDHLDEML